MTSGQADAPNHRDGYRTEIGFMMDRTETGNIEPRGSDISKDS